MYEDTSDKISDFSVLASLDTQFCQIQNKVVVIFKHFTQKCHTLRQSCWNALTLLIYPGVFCYFRAVPGASVYVHTASSPHLRRFKHRSDGGTFQTVICSRRGGPSAGAFVRQKQKCSTEGSWCVRENLQIGSALWVASPHLCFGSRQQRNQRRHLRREEEIMKSLIIWVALCFRQ